MKISDFSIILSNISNSRLTLLIWLPPNRSLSLSAVLWLSDITPGGSEARMVGRNTRWKRDNKKLQKPYVYDHIERAHLVDMELRPWNNIWINLSQNKPNWWSRKYKIRIFRNFWNLNLKSCTFEKNAFKVSVRNSFWKKDTFCTFLV